MLCKWSLQIVAYLTQFISLQTKSTTDYYNFYTVMKYDRYYQLYIGYSE